MRVTTKRVLIFGVSVLVVFSVVDLAGDIMLSRSVNSVDSLVPLEFFRATDSRQQWEIITDALEAGPKAGYTLTNIDIERAKELVYVGLTRAPEEWEGSGRVSASSATVRFLGEVYPGIKERTEQIDNHLKLQQLRDILYQHPPQGWRVVRAGLFGKWHASPS